jgi:Transposase
VWLCKVAERQMIRPSFVPPPPIRKLRDLTRYRADLVAARTAEKNRAEKLLEDDLLTEQWDVAAAQKARPPLPWATTLTGISCSAGPG